MRHKLTRGGSNSNPLPFTSSTLETFRADVGEVKAKYDYLKEKLDQIEAEKKEANDAIREAKRINHISEGKVAALQGSYPTIRLSNAFTR